MNDFWYTRSVNDTKEDCNTTNFFLHKNQIKDNNFWFDYINKLSKEPKQKIIIGLENLPAPVAFIEIAKALRQIIRNKNKEQNDYKKELTFLYKIACIKSFMIPYSKALKEPGYNIMINIPGKILFELDNDYNTIGTEKLLLLTKTDKKQLHSHFGEPLNHSTMHVEYYNLWKKYEDQLVKKKEIDDYIFKQKIFNLIKKQ